MVMSNPQLLGIRLQQLAYLDAVGRTGHYGDAADDLLVTQSALSQGLQRLEQALGTPLFEKVGRTHRLTAAGSTALVSARRILAEAERLGDDLADRSEGRTGTLRLGLVDAAALYLLSSQLADFRADHPDIELRLTVETSGRLLDLLAQFDVDVAIVVGPAPNEEAIELLREPMYVYGPPIDDVATVENWILYPEHSRTRLYIDQALASLGVRPIVRNESGNPSVIAQLVRLGGGWTVLPSGIAESIVDPLTRRSDAIAERPLFAVRRDNASHNPLVDRLLEAIA